MEDPRTIRARQEYEGKTFLTKDGKCEVHILKFNSGDDVVVEFNHSGLIKHVKMSNIRTGLANPFANSVVAFDTLEQEFVGNVYRTNSGFFIKIIAIQDKGHVTYQFMDEFGYIGTTTMQNIKKGQVRNPYERNKFGGYLGVGDYNGDAYDWLYNIWHNLIVRGTGGRATYYSKDFKCNELYENTMVCEEWLCYNTFAHWYITNISKMNPNYSYEIDKDILFPYYHTQTNDVKLYSPRTVVLIPHDLNVTIANISRHKLNGNSMGKDTLYNLENLMNKYFNNGAISHKTYIALRYKYFKDVARPTIDLYDKNGKDYITSAYNINN